MHHLSCRLTTTASLSITLERRPLKSCTCWMAFTERVSVYDRLCERYSWAPFEHPLWSNTGSIGLCVHMTVCLACLNAWLKSWPNFAKYLLAYG